MSEINLFSPSGRPHPQHIIDYIEAYKAVNPDNEVPTIWDRGNGWIEFHRPDGRILSLRKSRLVSTTATLRSMANDDARKQLQGLDYE